jgi:uncharacterized protein YebE (UPF0316 family)
MTYLVLNPTQKTKKIDLKQEKKVRGEKTTKFLRASHAQASRLAMQVVTPAHYHLTSIITQLGILDYPLPPLSEMS